VLESILHLNDLHDTLPTGSPHTFTGNQGYTARLDRIYLPSDSVMTPSAIPSNDPHISDHTPVVMDLLEETARTPFMWSANQTDIRDPRISTYHPMGNRVMGLVAQSSRDHGHPQSEHQADPPQQTQIRTEAAVICPRHRDPGTPSIVHGQAYSRTHG